MNRRVEKEWLDDLPPADPRAIGSRRDLRRLNAWMGNASILSAQLGSLHDDLRPTYLLELGAGDGDLLAQVARRLGACWRGTRATLLDRCNLLSARAADTFRGLGWEVDVVTAEVFDWYRKAQKKPSGIVVANLFLHHFESKSLALLFKEIAQQCRYFVALEPCRSRLALVFSRLVGLIGCNDVTRHDAPVSVRAGFLGSELSRLWPDRDGWLLREHRAGPFGHLLVARRASAD
jgi:hypothetical protein